MQSKSKIDGGNQGEEFGPDAFTFDELDRMVRRKTQREDRNFLSLRVFSNKFQDEIKHTTIEKHALEGTRVLAPRMYTVYLPRVSGGQKLIRRKLSWRTLLKHRKLKHLSDLLASTPLPAR